MPIREEVVDDKDSLPGCFVFPLGTRSALRNSEAISCLSFQVPVIICLVSAVLTMRGGLSWIGHESSSASLRRRQGNPCGPGAPRVRACERRVRYDEIKRREDLRVLFNEPGNERPEDTTPGGYIGRVLVLADNHLMQEAAVSHIAERSVPSEVTLVPAANGIAAVVRTDLQAADGAHAGGWEWRNRLAKAPDSIVPASPAPRPGRRRTVRTSRWPAAWLGSPRAPCGVEDCRPGSPPWSRRLRILRTSSSVSTTKAPGRVWYLRAHSWSWTRLLRRKTLRPCSRAIRACIFAPRCVGGFDDHGTLSEAGHDHVAPRERVGSGVLRGPELRDDQTASGDDIVCQTLVFRRIGAKDAGSENSDGPSAHRQGGLVAARIYPAGEPGEDAHLLGREESRHLASATEPVRGCVAGADDRHRAGIHGVEQSPIERKGGRLGMVLRFAG